VRMGRTRDLRRSWELEVGRASVACDWRFDPPPKVGPLRYRVQYKESRS